MVAGIGALALATVGLLLDPRIIGGEQAWAKPAKFAFSITLYLATLRWMLAAVHGHRRPTTAIAAVVSAAFALEMLWIVAQVLRGTTSHFDAATPLDAAAFDAAGGVVSFIFMATVVVAVLALRTRGLDAGVAAGIRWGLAVCCLGMAEAVTMLFNGFTATTIGGHTVGAPDGGPGLPFTGWSLLHGDLRIGHFLGLHAMQALPLLALLLVRCTPLDQRTRRDLVRVAGLGWATLVVLVWWQAERGQALLRPDPVMLAAAAALALTAGAATALVLGRRGDVGTGEARSSR